ncbi:unnamed protein product [Plutella xylostella]|uniref:(diamondback moth) hypothetical protein n=1 Tax=Plutella xylostella TaxID=51655 RepID=A0A8S4EJK6_PLUXY|nr:unnamed protein product [Plutella xylostella]
MTENNCTNQLRRYESLCAQSRAVSSTADLAHLARTILTAQPANKPPRRAFLPPYPPEPDDPPMDVPAESMPPVLRGEMLLDRMGGAQARMSYEQLRTDAQDLEMQIKQFQTIQLCRSNFNKEAARRIQLGWAAFRKLHHHIFSEAIPQSLKTKDFNQCVLPVMTYGAETWALAVGLVHRFKVAQRAMERAMLGVSLINHIRMRFSVSQRINITDISVKICKLKWLCAGHIC